MWALISFYCRAPIQAPLKDSAALDRIFCRWGIIRVSKKQVLNRQKMQQRKVNWSNYLVIASFDFLAHLVESINHVSLLYVNYHLHCTFYCHTLDIDLRFATAYLPTFLLEPIRGKWNWSNALWMCDCARGKGKYIFSLLTIFVQCETVCKRSILLVSVKFSIFSYDDRCNSAKRRRRSEPVSVLGTVSNAACEREILSLFRSAHLFYLFSTKWFFSNFR